MHLFSGRENIPEDRQHKAKVWKLRCNVSIPELKNKNDIKMAYECLNTRGRENRETGETVTLMAVQF